MRSPQGWPEHRFNFEALVKPYFDFQEELSYIDGIVFKGERVVIPQNLIKQVMDIIHESHLGIVKCKQLARDVVYWPGINKHIEDMVSRCATCQAHRKSQQKEPMIPTEVPNGPWEHVATDLFDCLGYKWLLVVLLLFFFIIFFSFLFMNIHITFTVMLLWTYLTFVSILIIIYTLIVLTV